MKYSVMDYLMAIGLLPFSFGLFTGVLITGLTMLWRYNLW